MATPKKPYISPVVRVDRFEIGVYGDYRDQDLQNTQPYQPSGEIPWQLNRD